MACIGRFYIYSSTSEDHLIKEVMDKELRGDNLQRIKHTEEIRSNEINSVCAKAVLKRCFESLPLRRKTFYEKTVARDCLFNFLRYHIILWPKGNNKQIYKDEKIIQVNEARQKQMNMVLVTMQYDMRWWRRCENDHGT